MQQRSKKTSVGAQRELLRVSKVTDTRHPVNSVLKFCGLV